MIDQIKVMLQPPEPKKRRCVVVRPLGKNRYQVKDELKRLFEAEADRSWRVGDPVTVSNGRIVARAADFKNLKVYEV